MTNHVHLLVTAEKPGGIAKLMQAIGRRYVQYINRSYHRTGSLWEGRFKSSVVQAEDYLLTCMRYIELNPVRANMANDPAQYRWSSYRHNGLGQADERIAPHPLYLGLGRTEEPTKGVSIAFNFLTGEKNCENLSNADPFDSGTKGVSITILFEPPCHVAHALN